MICLQCSQSFSERVSLLHFGFCVEVQPVEGSPSMFGVHLERATLAFQGIRLSLHSCSTCTDYTNR